MEPFRPAEARHHPSTEGERQAIREQLERMLANPLFKHSKRYPSLLRYIVEHTLEGDPTGLKERTLGVAVFSRAPDYDTNADPIVRTTAGEIRKRIAQYYHEAGHQADIRIDLSPGSYVPEFSPTAAPEVVQVKSSAPAPAARFGSRWPRYAVAVLIAAALLGTVSWFKPWAPRTALDRFWKPVLDSTDSVLLCVGQREFLGSSPEPRQHDASDLPYPAGSLENNGTPVTLFKLYYLGSQNVALHDVMTLGRLAGLLQARGKNYEIRGQLSTNFADLRNRPVVLVSGMDNDWTIRLMGKMRFRFEREANLFFIRDAQHPTNRDRSVDYTVPYMRLTRDYAVISRVLDPTTERMVVVAGGLTGYGTIAAGEFLTNPAYMASIEAQAPGNWERKSIQILVATEVIDGTSGPPRVVEKYFW
jgi:hypothetical protein